MSGINYFNRDLISVPGEPGRYCWTSP